MEKIVPFEKSNIKDDNEIQVDGVKVTYIQNSDCTENDYVQVLHIEARNNGVDRFISFSTDGENWWSINDTDSLVNLFNDFKNRASL